MNYLGFTSPKGVLFGGGGVLKNHRIIGGSREEHPQYEALSFRQLDGATTLSPKASIFLCPPKTSIYAKFMYKCSFFFAFFHKYSIIFAILLGFGERFGEQKGSIIRFYKKMLGYEKNTSTFFL